MFKKRTLVSLLAVGSFALAACSTEDGDMDTTTPAVEEQEETTDEKTATEETVTEETDVLENDYENIKVTPEEAFDTFMDKYPDAKVKKVQLEQEMGGYVYKVEGFEGTMEYEIEIDPFDGSITKELSETDDDMDDMEITREHVEKVKMLVDEALADAGAEARLEEWTIEMDDGRAELDIDIDKKGLDDEEHTYDVETGELIEIDR